jgi:hypothetical protein
MNAADPGWRQLGAVLLEAGLLSEHDLAAALAEQQRSGRRLGEILVTRGLVSKAALANALAEQHGGLLRTEHGFATGLRGLSGSPPAGSGPEQPAASPPLSLTQPPEPQLSNAATSTAAPNTQKAWKPTRATFPACQSGLPGRRRRHR